MALRQRQPRKTLILHSDRGSQFASAAYRQVLAEHDLFSGAGNRALFLEAARKYRVEGM